LRRARVGPGALWSDVIAAAAPFGLAPLSGTPSVGVTGYTLGGGTGWLSRKHGFAADSLLRADLVTAEGVVVTASGRASGPVLGAARRQRQLRRRDLAGVRGPPTPLTTTGASRRSSESGTRTTSSGSTTTSHREIERHRPWLYATILAMVSKSTPSTTAPTTYWPLFGLRLRTPRLELRMPSLRDLDALAELAAAGVHDPETQPFQVAWTDVTPLERARGILQHNWATWGAWTPANWTLNLAVAGDGKVT
jgi:FAD binding domain